MVKVTVQPYVRPRTYDACAKGHDGYGPTVARLFIPLVQKHPALATGLTKLNMVNIHLPPSRAISYSRRITSGHLQWGGGIVGVGVWGGDLSDPALPGRSSLCRPDASSDKLKFISMAGRAEECRSSAVVWQGGVGG